MRAVTVATSIFQISSSSTHIVLNLFLCRFIWLFRSRVFPLFIKSAFPSTPVRYSNLIILSARDGFLAQPTIRWGQNALARHPWKNPCENKEMEAHKESFLDLRFSSLLSFRPLRTWNGTEGGNCIKVDVGYARAAPSVRGIINSQRRAVTKVRACSLVSRSVSGRADSSSPSASAIFTILFLFSSARVPLTWKSPNRSERNNSRPQPSSVSITAHLFLFYLNVRVKFPNAYFSLFFLPSPQRKFIS